MSENLELNGRRALVTGGTQGIGEAVVARLREVGVRVLTTARKTPDASHAANLFVPADVATADGCALVADAVRVVGLREAAPKPAHSKRSRGRPRKAAPRPDSPPPMVAAPLE